MLKATERCTEGFVFSSLLKKKVLILVGIIAKQIKVYLEDVVQLLLHVFVKISKVLSGKIFSAASAALVRLDLLECNIGQSANHLLVLDKVLHPGNHLVLQVTVSAPAQEWFPVLVKTTSVGSSANLLTLINDHLHKVVEGDCSILGLEVIMDALVEVVMIVKHLVLEG